MAKSLHQADSGQEPVFVFSCQSSGDSLLRSLLDSHPAIACPPGLDLGPLCRSLEIALESTLGKVSGTRTASEERLIVIDEIRAVIGRIMQPHGGSQEAELWCDSACNNLPHRDLLQAVFPRSRCICLYRNCLDTVAGLLQASRRRAETPLQADEVHSMARMWLERTGQVFVFQRRHSAQCLAVQYESLLADPPATLSSITAFLGLDPAAELPASQFQPSREEQAEGGPSLLKSIPADLLMKINRLMRSLGYPALQPSW